jgi:hypothetical protein
MRMPIFVSPDHKVRYLRTGLISGGRNEYLRHYAPLISQMRETATIWSGRDIDRIWTSMTA